MLSKKEIAEDRKILRKRWRKEGKHQGRSLACALYQQGINKGDVVAVLLPTQLETMIIYHALAHLGAIALPIIHTYGESDVINILQHSKAKMLIIRDRWQNIDYYPRLARYRQIKSLRDIVVIGTRAPDFAIPWAQVMAQPDTQLRETDIDPNAVSLLIYTSGTTGTPKGVQHSSNSFLAEMNSQTYLAQGPYLCCLPAGHFCGYTFMLRCVLKGLPTLFMDSWNANFAAEVIHKYRVKETGGTPNFLFEVLEAAQKSHYDLSSLNTFSVGGANTSSAQVRLSDQLGCPACPVYGSMEHPTVTYSLSSMPVYKRSTTDGKVDVKSGIEVKIVDSTGKQVPMGQEGEIASRGPDMFVGYTDSEQDTMLFLPGGWYLSGDIGRLDNEGYLHVTDRIKDIIKRGCDNISSTEIEEILTSYPKIKDAAVISAPDKKYSEKVCASVVLVDGVSHITLDEVSYYFRSKGIARFKIPELIDTVETLPRTASGKVKKNVLRLALSSNNREVP
jgi:acyl-coenzyme A synthetase/AMP-(fatty) acid ligase